MTQHDILLFAAGLGTRMAPLTNDRPKPLITVGGTTLLDRALSLTDTPQINRRIVNAHYLAPMIHTHLAGRDVIISDETDALLETGGGLRKARALMGPDPILTLNTDAVWSDITAIAQLTAAWRDDMDALLLLVPPARAFGHTGAGDFTTAPDGKLTRGPGLIYTGLQMLRSDLLDSIPETAFSLNLLWDKMLARGTLYGTSYSGKWCDVGRPDAIATAEGMLSLSDV